MVGLLLGFITTDGRKDQRLRGLDVDRTKEVFCLIKSDSLALLWLSSLSSQED